MIDLNTIEIIKFHYTAIATSTDEAEKSKHWEAVNKIAADNPDSVKKISDLRLEVAFELINEERKKRGLNTVTFTVVNGEEII